MLDYNTYHVIVQLFTMESIFYYQKLHESLHFIDWLITMLLLHDNLINKANVLPNIALLDPNILPFH